MQYEFFIGNEIYTGLAETIKRWGWVKKKKKKKAMVKEMTTVPKIKVPKVPILIKCKVMCSRLIDIS